MIVSFSVSNFRSFSSEETISLVASKRLAGNHDAHAVPIPDSNERVLRTAVLYGANGAGKSNLFNALRYLKSVALEPRQKSAGTGRERFRFAATESEPSCFDLQFVAGNRLYRFGFKVDDERFIEEWLYLVSDRQKSIYGRATDDHGKVVVEAHGLKTTDAKLAALATVGGPQNQTFLATVNATLEGADFGEHLGGVLTWFKDSLMMINPDESFGALGSLIDRDPGFRSFASAFLRSASTGVDHLEVQKKGVTQDEFHRLALDLPMRIIRERALDKGDIGPIKLGDGSELLAERRGEYHMYQLNIQAAHEHEPGKVVRLNLADESDGTRRLLNLIPALYHLRTSGAVYVIDEIDRSLHPILVKEFLDFFLKQGGGGQIIVTTHESNLLDQELLRRDEIWFAEKDQTGATRLYSLLDFKVRNDLEIRKHYLQGRFGAVPFLGDLESLLSKPDQPA